MTNDDYNDEYEEPQDLLGLEKFLQESAKITDPKKELVKDLFRHYAVSLADFLNSRFSADYETVFLRIRDLNNIISWIKLEKKEVEALVALKKQKNLEVYKEERFLEIIEMFLQKTKTDKDKYGFH